jgi:hypothetical protein
MHRVIGGPGPASESGAAVVRERLLDLSFGVHDEGPVLGHRFPDGSALQKEELAIAFARAKFEVAGRFHLYRGMRLLFVGVDGDGGACKEVEVADRPLAFRPG